MTKRFRTLLLGTVLLGLASPALAHRQWLLPSATIFSGSDDYVTVDAAASNDLFFPDHRPSNLAAIKVWAPDGTAGQIENGSAGHVRSTFDVKLDKPGTWKIGTQMSAIMGTYKVDGQERRIGGRPGGGPAGGPGQRRDGPGTTAGGNVSPASPPPPPITNVADIPANATDVRLTQVMGRNEIFVTAGAPTSTVFQPTNKGLEMVPVTHPAELVAGEEAKFRFLVDGKPASGLKLSVLPGGKRYRDGDGMMEVTAGADGVAAIKWPAPGMYWLNATLSDDKATEPRVTSRRLSYTSTMEVLAP